MPRRARRNDSKRKARASEAINHLSSIIQAPEDNDDESVKSAARDILRIGKSMALGRIQVLLDSSVEVVVPR